MSPEQVSRGTVDRRSDVFTLGIVLYELTVGQRLFKGADEVETLRAVLDMKVRRPSEVVPGYPADLERIVLKALERSPERRYQSARDMQVDLEAFTRDQKLEISSAALAEWMEASFGPKREIWHTLPLLPGDSSDHSGSPPAEKTAATRKVPLADLVAAGADADAAVARPPRRAGCCDWMVLVLAGGGAFAWRHRSAREPPVQAGAGPRNDTVMLVAENGSVAIEPRAPAPAAPTVEPIAPAPAETPRRRP